MRDLDELKERVRAFCAERDWDRFHNPKNLAMALSVEASELVELFQWLTEEQSVKLDEKQRGRVSRRSSPTCSGSSCGSLTGSTSTCSKPPKRELAQNVKKYPADLVRGDPRKYNEY